MTKSDYSPRLPRSISGGDWRPSLDHIDIEAIGRRGDRLYQTAALSDDERGKLIKTYELLGKADRFLARRLRDQPIWITQLRPRFWNDWFGIEGNQGQTETACGFVWRVLEFIERLEARHVDVPVATEPVSNARPVLVDGDPGDDI